MTRVMGLVLFGVVACGSKAEEPKVDPRAASGFARALEAVAAADPAQSAAMLAEGAYETIAPSMKCFQGFAAAGDVRKRVEALLDCGLACTPDAIQAIKNKEPRSWMAALAGACEAEHYGLEKSSAAMLSPEWFLLHKIGEEAARRGDALRGPDRARLEQAMAGFHLALPLPPVATGLYELPSAAEAASLPVVTRAYVIVAANGRIRVGASPTASLGMRGAAIEVRDGQVSFPGNEAAKEDLKAIVLEASGVSKPVPVEPPDAGPPAADAGPSRQAGQINVRKGRTAEEAKKDAIAKKQAIENARTAGILGSLSGTTDGTFGSLAGLERVGTIGMPAGLHGEVVHDLRGELGKDRDPVPLLLADGSRPAAEVIDLATVLPFVFIGVAAPEDTAARALAVDIRSQLNATGRHAGQAWVDLAAGKLEEARKAAGGQEETVVIVAADAPWKDAVEVAAIAIARGAQRVIFTTTTLGEGGPGGGGTGSAGAILGHGAYGQGKPSVSILQEGETTATGDLDKNVIRRVMHAHIAAIRACYERELLHDAKLEGRVDLAFTIARDGTVKDAKGTGLAEVSECAVRVVKSIKFPAPAGGGVVNVRYPLVFKPKGE